MSLNTAHLDASPDQVWAVLADGWLYPLWVVGATRMRSVDQAWPARGSGLHHSAGSWPLVLDDSTEVLDCEPERLLRLKARGWPFGEAEVSIELTAEGTGTRVTLREDAVSGPGALLPGALQRPVLTWRNSESLKRLGFLVEGRTG